MTLPRWLRWRRPQQGHEKRTEVVRWGQWVGGYPATTDVTDASYLDAFANPWVYACSSAIANAAATVPLITSVKRGDELVAAPTSELGKLLDRMNAGDNQQSVIRQTVLHLALYGNAYWMLLRPYQKAAPMAVQVVAPSIVGAIPGQAKFSTIIGQYEISESGGAKTRVSADDVVHFRLPSGEDMYYGQSPLRALEQTINTWLSTQNYNESFFKRGGVPTGVLTSTYELKPENRTIMGELWDQWRTSNAAGRPLILGRDLDYKVLGVSPDGTITKTFPDSLRDTICSVYGVPPCIVGIYEYANYANANAQERMFWSNCVLGYLTLIEQAIMEQLAPQFEGGDSYVVAFNTDGIEALQPQLADKATQAAQLVSHGIWTINEARGRFFDMAPVPWGDTFWGTFSQVPLSNIDADEPVLLQDKPEPELQPIQPALTGSREPTQEEAEEQKSPPPPKMVVRLVGRKMQRLSAEGRVAHWKAHDARRRTKEKVYARAMGGWYDDMAEEMVGNLGASKASIVRSPRVDSIMFDLGKAALKLRDATSGPLKAAYEEAAKEAAKLVGVSFDVDTAAEQALLKARGQLMKTVARTAQDRARNSLAEGIANGENIEALKARVREWNTSGKEYHVENVARTEVGCAMNTAAVDTYRENGFGREWLAVQDDRTREDHAEMDGVTVGPDDQFTLPDGEVCDGPGDSNLGPEHVCNCFVDGQVPIFTSEGWKPIREIRVGTKVLTHMGRFRPVTALSRQPGYAGDVVAIHFQATCGLSGKRKKITVTPEHPILTPGGWRLAGDIQAGDSVVAVGLPCPECGATTFMYESSPYCSKTCRGKATTRRQWSDAGHRESMSASASEQMRREYADGTRDPNAITQKARSVCFERHGPGGFLGAHREELQEAITEAITAKYGSHMEHLKQWAFPALGKSNHGSRLNKSMARFLEKIGWEALPEYPIGRRRADFYVPSERLFIECDGEMFHQDAEKDRLRDIEILSQYPDHQIAHVRYGKGDKGRPQWEYRSLETLNHEGAYGSAEVIVSKVERWKLRKARTRWNFAVEEDESYVAKGIAVHNCRCTTAPVADWDGKTE